MAVDTRPYFIIHKGTEHMVEASQPAIAVQHVVGQEITELRPARASEVLAWTRAGKPIARAGQKTPPALETGDGLASTGGEQAVAREEWPVFDASDARTWLIEACGGLDQAAQPLAVFDAMREAGSMTLAQFDEIKTLSGEFASAIAAPPNYQEGEVISLKEPTAALKKAPMPFDEVVRLIGEQKRRELFKPE
jgi:hypothetical protein